MLWFIAVSAAAPALPPVTAQANATVRVVRSVHANQEEWQRRSTIQRREIIIDDGRSRPVRVRLFEYQ